MPHHVVYKPAERPECEALVDDRTWTADVGYSTAPAENRIGRFPRTGCAHSLAVRALLGLEEPQNGGG